MKMNAPADSARVHPAQKFGGVVFIARLRAISMVAEAPHRNKE
jgi:hypothetical protein